MHKEAQMKLWFALLIATLLLPSATSAQEPPVPLQEAITQLNIPAEWGVLKSVTPLPGNPPYYSFFFEDAAGTIRIVPVYLSLSGDNWYLLNKRGPVAVIRRGQ